MTKEKWTKSLLMAIPCSAPIPDVLPDVEIVVSYHTFPGEEESSTEDENSNSESNEEESFEVENETSENTESH